jgi:hypothetical protein
LGQVNAPEFAEEYSPSERKRLIAWYIVVVLLLAGILQLFLLPWLRGFVSTSHCHEVMGVPGTTVLLYGLFVGIPLLSGVVAGILLLPSAIQSITTGRFPPPGTKVFRRTEITTGWQAATRGYATCAVILFLFGMAVWGYFQARDLDGTFLETRPDISECAVSGAEPQ